MTNKCS